MGLSDRPAVRRPRGCACRTERPPAAVLPLRLFPRWLTGFRLPCPASADPPPGQPMHGVPPPGAARAGRAQPAGPLAAPCPGGAGGPALPHQLHPYPPCQHRPGAQPGCALPVRRCTPPAAECHVLCRAFCTVPSQAAPSLSPWPQRCLCVACVRLVWCRHHAVGDEQAGAHPPGPR